MRVKWLRLIGYVVAIVTSWVVAQWVHMHDATWGWYRLSSTSTTNNDDALALLVFLVVLVLGILLAWKVTE